LDSLAERMHMEKTYFIKQFKKHIGATPLAYLKRVKMEKAKDLIINSDMNITQISDFLGYLSIQHFSNDFKKTMGKSPKEYSHNK
jgi:AraC-like DNA-binding protein